MLLPRLHDLGQSQSHHQNAQRKTKRSEIQRDPVMLVACLDVKAEMEDVAIDDFII